MATTPVTWKVYVILREKGSRFYSQDIPGSTLLLYGNEKTIRSITLEITPELWEKIVEIVRRRALSLSSPPLHPFTAPSEIIEYFYRNIVLNEKGAGKYWELKLVHADESMPEGFLEQCSEGRGHV